MITISLTENGDLRVTQAMTSPAVYLDHWALRIISENDDFTARFVRAMEARGGTLALSWVNLSEFVQVIFPEQIRKAEDLVEASLTRLFLLEVDPGVVIRREDELLAGGLPRPPHGDSDFLKLLATINPNSVAPLSARGLFDGLRDPGIVQRKAALADAFTGQIEQLRVEVANHPPLAAAVRAVPRGPEIQRGTRFILRELVRPLVTDKGKKITENDAIDFFHAVVPVAYCDYVLLDKPWAAQVAQIGLRSKKTGMNVPMAAVFSRGRSGVEELLRTLDVRNRSLG
ncbi:MAG: hypothetical protein ACREU8_11445 [Gammaproteobacteria bacterium]